MFVALSLALTLSAAPEVEAVKVWRGAEGQLVDVLTLKPRASKKALVRVRNADSEHDGLVLPCTVEADSESTRFTTRYQASEWTVFVQKSGGGAVFVPGKNAFDVKFDQASTDALQPATVLDAQATQEKEGRFALFARKAWPHLEKKYQDKADAAVVKLTKSCGRKVSFSFDWASFGDDVMADVDVWSLCSPLVTQFERSCAPAKSATTLSCRLGKSFALGFEGDGLVFTTTSSPAGAADFFKNSK